MFLHMCGYREKEKKSHINSNCSAVTVVVVKSSNTKCNYMGACMYTLQGPFPGEFFSFSENLQWQNLPDDIFLNWQNIS